MNRFNQETHEYFIGERKVFSVTGILKALGIINDQFYTEEGKERGKAVHEATEFLDDDDLDLESLHPKIRPYVDAYQQFKIDTGFVHDRSEAQVYNEVFYYGGTLDRTGNFRNGERVLIDIKSGSVEEWAALQTAGYQACLKERYRRYALELKSTGKYKLHPFLDPNDINLFLSAAAVANWKLNQGVITL